MLAVGRAGQRARHRAPATRRPHRCARCRTSGATRHSCAPADGGAPRAASASGPRCRRSGSRRRRRSSVRSPLDRRSPASRRRWSGGSPATAMRVAVVVGAAGAGKTFALAAAREAWEASGTPVIGAAIAWRAARGLEDEAGIPVDERRGAAGSPRDGDRLPRRSVLVVDEAAMVGTRQLVELSEAVRRVRGKLVLVGDDRQVPEIEAGGAFRGLRARLPVIELRENRRQVEAWERDALALLRDGRGREALERYDAHGRLRAGDGDARAPSSLSRTGGPPASRERSVMLAYRRADVAELNRRARELMVASGAVRGPELVIGGTRVRRRRSSAAAPERSPAGRRQRRPCARHGRRRRAPAARRSRRRSGCRASDATTSTGPAVRPCSTGTR